MANMQGLLTIDHSPLT